MNHKNQSGRPAELLRAAQNLIFTEGPGRFTMRRLGEAVGITEPAVYRHFGSKEELLLALIAFMFDGWQEKLDALCALDLPASEKVIRLGKIHISHLIDHQFNPILLLSEAADPNQFRVAKALGEKGQRFTETMASIFTKGKIGGEFPPDLCVRFATQAVMGVLQGSLIRWTLTHSNRGLAADLEGSIRLILRGVAVFPATK